MFLLKNTLISIGGYLPLFWFCCNYYFHEVDKNLEKGSVDFFVSLFEQFKTADFPFLKQLNF